MRHHTLRAGLTLGLTLTVIALAGAQQSAAQPPAAAGPAASSTAASAQTGVLLLAHGGKATWNAEVDRITASVNAQRPAEVAFGMASRGTIQAAVDRLQARGVTNIVAVPLFISSHSSVVTSTEYLLGLRDDAPEDLAMFAKMDHGSGGTGAHAGHAPVVDNTRPVAHTVPIRMAAALDDDPVVAAILTDRAKALSTNQADEVAIIVAHGPVSDEENALWLKNMGNLAAIMRKDTQFARIEVVTVRDDAEEPVRAVATQELAALVERAKGEGRRVLIVPLLLSYGGIEAGIRKRLDGLDYTMGAQGLLPDERIAGWVLARAAQHAAAGATR